MKLKTVLAATLLSSALISTSALARHMVEVTITNLTGGQISPTNPTGGQIFSPVLVVSHDRRVSLFQAGEPASDEVVAIAEGGDTSLMKAHLDDLSGVSDFADSGGPLMPGDSVTITLDARHANRVSVLSMLVSSNDAFMAINGERIAYYPGEHVFLAPAYDAGSEANDEFCANLPGPCDGMDGTPGSEDEAEGYIHIHAGIHGIGGLDPATYDWRNPVARVKVKRVR